MSEYNSSNNQIIVKRKTIYLITGLFVMILAVMGFQLVFSLPFGNEDTFVNVLMLIFVFAFFVLVFCMGLYAFVTNSRQITINDEGIICSTWFIKRKLKWSEIADWGLSYYGETRWEGKTYCLYFSEEQHPTINKYKKKLKRRTIKAFVIGKEYSDAVRNIIPFCMSKTEVKPFIGEDTNPFI